MRGLLKKTGAFAAAMLAGVAMAAERTDDGRGLVEAYAGTVNGDGYGPFRHSATAVTGGTTGSQTGNSIARDLPNTWAPERIYQLERYGAVTAVFPNLVPNASYVLEFHLAENYWTSAGARLNRFIANGVVIENSLDIFKEAGGANKALCRQYSVTADAEGNLTVKLETIKDNAHFSGLALFGSSAPSTPALVCPKPTDSFDLAFSWQPATDVLRYHFQKGESADGPWTDLEVFASDVTSTTLVAAYDPTATDHYRLVASNGVGVAASPVVTFAPDASSGVSLKTRGETVEDNPAAIYHVNAIGEADDPVNALAADSISIMGYLLDIASDSALAVGEGQTLSAGVLGVNAAGAALTVSGAGTVSPRGHQLSLTVSAGELRMEAPVSDAAGEGVLAKNGAGRATLAGGLSGFTSLSLSGGTLAYENAADEDFAAALSGAGAFEKRGEGRLTLTSQSSAFTGDARVAEGTLRFGRTGSVFPDTTGALTVEPGATLDVGVPGAAAQLVSLGSRKVVVSGSGVDGKGAIVNDSGVSQYNALKVGELAGDATFGGTIPVKDTVAGRWDFRGGSLAMNGHGIEKVGSNMVCLTGINLDEGGTVKIDVKEGYWSSETYTSYSGGPENAFNVFPGATLDFYSMSKPITWTVNLADGATLNFRNGGTNCNHLTGPVSLAKGTNVVSVQWDVHGRISGPVTGEGMMHVKGGWGNECLWLENGANDWTGGTKVEYGAVRAASKGSLPGYDDSGRLVVTNAGTVILPLGTGEWDSSDVSAMLTGGALRTANSRVGVDVVPGGATVSEDLSSELGGLSKHGAGTLDMTGAVNLPAGQLRVVEGTLALDGSSSYAREVAVMGNGTLVLTNGATLAVQMPNSGWRMAVGGKSGAVAEVVVEDGSTLKAEEDCTLDKGTSSIAVGVTDSDRGVLTVRPGGTVAHKVVLGAHAGDGSRQEAQGAVVQNGGLVQNQGGASNDIRVGDYGYGYYELNAGELEWWGYGSIGGVGAKGMGVMVQHGGTFRYVPKWSAGRVALCRGGSGVYYNDGGLLDNPATSAALVLGEADNPGVRGTSATFTLDGANAEARFSAKQNVHLGNRPEHVATINLNAGGTLESGTIAARPSYAPSNTADTIFAYVNFDGGVFRAPATMQMFSTASNCSPNAVTVYKGGVVFDVPDEAHRLTVSQPLLAPAGQGVASIAAPAALLNATGYIGAPFIKISGGGGTGATAVALYDSKTRKVTGVRVTSAGTGYTSAPTVTATGGGFTNLHVCTATLAPNAATGGIVKRGAGALTLSATNTFGGGVTLEGGTLSFAISNALPAGAALTLKEGVLSAVQPLVCGAVTKTGSGAVELAPCTSFAGSPAVTVEEGELKFGAGGPGLACGVLNGSANWTEPCAMESVALGPVQANSNDGWTDNTTVVYRGFIWNRTEADATWTFLEHFDDYIRLWIDGEDVFSDYSWNVPSKKTLTLSPGPHSFELRLGQGGGGAGPSSQAATVTENGVSYPIPAKSCGFMVDWQGRDTYDLANFENPMDAGDGAVFTVSASDSGLLPAGTRLTVADGASLDLGAETVQTVADLSGAGAVTSGSLRPTGAWTVDAGDFTTGRHLTLADGALDLSAVTGISFANATGLPLRGMFVIAEASGGFTGDLRALEAQMKGLPKGNWKLSVSGTRLRLVYPSGTVFVFR